MAPRRRKLLTTKEVAKILKVNTELVTYLRQNEKLPFIRNGKYIMFSEPEVIRWRNKQLAENATPIMNLRDYYTNIRLYKFVEYTYFREKVNEVTMLDGDFVIQYIKRYNPEKSIVDVVGDLVHTYWDERRPKCELCGRVIIGSLPSKLCSVCRERQINPDAFSRDSD